MIPLALQHDPKGVDGHSNKISARGFFNALTLLVLVLALLMLFAGYPILYQLLRDKVGTKGAFNLGGTNGTGQVASLVGLRPLVDPDTPSNAKTWTSPVSKYNYNLQFSDEFEQGSSAAFPFSTLFWILLLTVFFFLLQRDGRSGRETTSSLRLLTSGMALRATTNGIPPKWSTRLAALSC